MGDTLWKETIVADSTPSRAVRRHMKHVCNNGEIVHQYLTHCSRRMGKLHGYRLWICTYPEEQLAPFQKAATAVESQVQFPGGLSVEALQKAQYSG